MKRVLLKMAGVPPQEARPLAGPGGLHTWNAPGPREALLASDTLLNFCVLGLFSKLQEPCQEKLAALLVPTEIRCATFR